MAKGNLFLSQGRGKVGSVVFSVIKGQQIERVYNPQPANPRSYAQQAQRALLANMTKFYKRGTQNFYKFAFEDKTSRESDYNAFARNNMQKGVYLPKELYDNAAAPALGNYLLTRGSIDHGLTIVTYADKLCLQIELESEITTVGQLSAIILAREPNIQPGDIFTLVCAESDMVPPATVLSSLAPTWDTIQFYIDPNDVTLLTAVGLACIEDESTGTYHYIARDINAVDRASFGALTISRVTDSGLKVSDTEVVAGPCAGAMIEWYKGEYARRQAAISWGGNPEAFLAGGQLDILPNISAITVGPRSNTPYAFGSGVLAVSGSNLQLGATLTGTALRTTAQGAKYEFVYFDATVYDIDSRIMEYKSRRVATLEGTGTATQISISGLVPMGDMQPNSQNQGFGVIKVDGVPVWWGLVTTTA